MGQIILNSLINGSYYALLALSFNLLLGTVKFFDVSFGVRALLGSYVVFALIKGTSLPVALAALIGVAVSLLIGVLSEKLVFYPLKKKKASFLVSLIASFGLFIVLGALVFIFFGSQFQTLSYGWISETVNVGLGALTHFHVIFVASAPLVFLLTWLFLKKSRYGEAVRAVGDNEELAEISGINVKNIRMLVYLISGLIAVWVTIFLLFETGLDPTQGFKIILKTIIASIIGGVGSPAGGFVAGYFLGTIENFAGWYLGVTWVDLVSFLLLILFLNFRPEGIFGKK